MKAPAHSIRHFRYASTLRYLLRENRCPSHNPNSKPNTNYKPNPNHNLQTIKSK